MAAQTAVVSHQNGRASSVLRELVALGAGQKLHSENKNIVLQVTAADRGDQRLYTKVLELKSPWAQDAYQVGQVVSFSAASRPGFWVEQSPGYQAEKPFVLVILLKNETPVLTDSMSLAVANL